MRKVLTIVIGFVLGLTLSVVACQHRIIASPAAPALHTPDATTNGLVDVDDGIAEDSREDG